MSGVAKDLNVHSPDDATTEDTPKKAADTLDFIKPGGPLEQIVKEHHDGLIGKLRGALGGN